MSPPTRSLALPLLLLLFLGIALALWAWTIVPPPEDFGATTPVRAAPPAAADADGLAPPP